MSVGYRWGFFILLLGTTLAKVKSYSLPYEASDKCKNSTTEYLNEAHCCSKCRPGTRMATLCTSNTDTVCEPCPDGMYSDNMNYYPNCFLCAKCPEEKGMKYAKQCSKESNAVCVCKPGWYCVSQEEPDNSCSTCEKHRMCGPGKGAKSPGTSTENVRCINCPPETFSNETSFRKCQPHTRCELQGRRTLVSGTTKTDTVCGPVEIVIPKTVKNHPPITTMSTPTAPSKQPFTKPSIVVPPYTLTSSFPVLSSHQPQDEKFTAIWIGLPVAGLLVVLLTLTLCIRHRKGKPVVHAGAEEGHCCNSHISNPAENHGLLADSSSDPSTASSSDSQSQGTGVSQDCLHAEHSTVSSPVVNLSFTATINCQVNPTTGSCSIPISPCVHSLEPEFPLSQEEELSVSCEQEDSKDAIQSVQESGMTKY
ncbi:tumor necrosis factor receptor superfamily, member 1B precursor [Silurus meridionalis]|nr:tumor necrosis factor receptor superfamily, member 1B precursor [Silurus meridionalis]